MTSVGEQVRCGARSRVEYFRCEMSELVDESLTVNLVQDASSIVISTASQLLSHLDECVLDIFKLLTVVSNDVYKSLYDSVYD